MLKGLSHPTHGMYVCVAHLNRCKTSNPLFVSHGIFLFFICREMWHTIRDHVQRSYLIVWDTEPDQLCVHAPFFLCPWQPAKPRTGQSIPFTCYYCHILLFSPKQVADCILLLCLFCRNRSPIVFIDYLLTILEHLRRLIFSVRHYLKTTIIFVEYYQEIYFKSNCLGWFARLQDSVPDGSIHRSILV